MAFDVKSFATQVRPSPGKPSPKPFANSVFDAGSPQYVRPEDLFLDIQAQLFGLGRKDAKNINGIDPSNFRERWLKDAVGLPSVRRVGNVEDKHLVNAAMSLLRCPHVKKQKSPTLLPAVAALGFYKNIAPNLPNSWHDQLRPALSFADEVRFAERIGTLKDRLCNGMQADDSLKQLAVALLPPSGGSKSLAANAGQVQLHDGPLLKDFAENPSRPLSVCRSLVEALDTLIVLEATVPRVLWTRWLVATLRLWLPLFFLKRCTVTSQAAGAMKSVLRGRIVPNAQTLTAELISSGRILRGGREWLNQLAPIVQNYIRGRFEISIVLELANLSERLRLYPGNFDPANAAHLDRVRQELDLYEVDARRSRFTSFRAPVGILDNVSLSMPGDVGILQVGSMRKYPFEEWLTWLAANRGRLDALAKIIGANDAIDLVERVYGGIRPDYEPLKKGFGKNMREYVGFTLGAPIKRDRDPEFPDELNLIYRGEGGRRARQISVQPGPQLLVLLVQLVSYQARAKYRAAAKLSDLLDLFDTLGVDFRSNPNDFESLKAELLYLGLLQSSADAAEAASLNPAYNF